MTAAKEWCHICKKNLSFVVFEDFVLSLWSQEVSCFGCGIVLFGRSFPLFLSHIYFYCQESAPKCPVGGLFWSRVRPFWSIRDPITGLCPTAEGRERCGNETVSSPAGHVGWCPIGLLNEKRTWLSLHTDVHLFIELLSPLPRDRNRQLIIRA